MGLHKSRYFCGLRFLQSAEIARSSDGKTKRVVRYQDDGRDGVGTVLAPVPKLSWGFSQFWKVDEANFPKLRPLRSNPNP